MGLREDMAALKATMQSIVDTAKAENRDITEAEADEIEAKAAEHGSLAEQLKKADDAAALVNALANVAEPTTVDTVKHGSVGMAFVKSPAYQAFRNAHPLGTGSGTPIHIEARGLGTFADVIGRKATITTETGHLVAVREPGIRPGIINDEPLTFLDLITTGTTNVAFSEYVQVTAETVGAAIVAEGDLKPLSDISTGLAESRAFTYADGFDITNQTLSDEGALVAFLEARIRRHIMNVVEDKVLRGTGVNEPLGILATSGVLGQAFDTDIITTIAGALAQFETYNQGVSPQAIVVNPADALKIRLLRENGATGGFLLGSPLQQALPTPFGVPLVTTPRLTAGQALVGRFDSMNFLTLEALNVLAFNQHKDFAQRNMTYVRAELRGRQVFYSPREVVVAELAEEETTEP